MSEEEEEGTPLVGQGYAAGVSKGRWQGVITGLACFMVLVAIAAIAGFIEVEVVHPGTWFPGSNKSESEAPTEEPTLVLPEEETNETEEPTLAPVICEHSEELKGEANRDYVGCQTKTRDGQTCLPWDDFKTHMTVTWSRWGANLYYNYCRNPRVPPSRNRRETIWCYTGPWKWLGWHGVGAPYGLCDPIGWEETNVTEETTAKPVLSRSTPAPTPAPTPEETPAPTPSPETPAPTPASGGGSTPAPGCGHSEGMEEADGHDYRGCQTKTRDGKTCKDWKDFQTQLALISAGEGIEKNYCRNLKVPPAGSKRRESIWCYTTDWSVGWHGVGAEYGLCDAL